MSELRAAANAGNVESQIALGGAYYEGNKLGVTRKKVEEAVKYYRMAADQGDKHAQVFMARRCETGEGILQNSALGGLVPQSRAERWGGAS